MRILPRPYHDDRIADAVVAYRTDYGAAGLEAVDANETIILCPANHSSPTFVTAHPGAPGYEAVATCLASPEVRARTEGVIAWRRQVA